MLLGKETSESQNSIKAEGGSEGASSKEAAGSSKASQAQAMKATRLRIMCCEAWGFESPLPHYPHDLVRHTKILPKPVLKDQLGYAWLAGFLFASALRVGKGETLCKCPLPSLIIANPLYSLQKLHFN